MGMKFSVVIFMLLAAVCSASPPYKVIRIKECKGTFETKGTSASDSDKDMKCLSHPPVHFKPICTHKFPVGFKPLPADFKPPAGMKPVAPLKRRILEIHGKISAQ